MPNTVRAFIAVKIPATTQLKRVLSELESLGKPVKAVTADNMHVTLKFLGNTPESQIPKIAAIVQTICEPLQAFDVRVMGLGAFPHARRPSVVWVGLENAETLIRIAKQMEDKLKPLGFAREKRSFRPHLTLARIKSKPPAELKAIIEQHQAAEFGAASIRSVELIRSELRSDGPHYTSLVSANLSNA